MEVIIKDGVEYKRDVFLLERDFEKIVLAQYKHIFGINSILFDKRMIRTFTGTGTIPDAFVLCPDINKWYVIEVELATHSVYTHIIPQINKFRAALRNNRNKLVQFFDDEIIKDQLKTAHWHIAAASNNSIHRAVSELVDTTPEVIVIIDNANKELEEALSDPAYQNVHIRVFKSFNRSEVSSADSIYLFDSLERPSPRISRSSQRVQATITTSTIPPVPSIVSVISLPNNNGSTLKIDTNRRVQNSSPSPKEWAILIPELHGLDHLKRWKDICEYFSIDCGVDSARRVLKKWVLNSRPDLPPVP